MWSKVRERIRRWQAVTEHESAGFADVAALRSDSLMPRRDAGRGLDIGDLDRADQTFRRYGTFADSPWEEFRDRYLSLPPWFESDLDPYSEAYARQQDRLWEWMAGRSGYEASEQEQTPEIPEFDAIYRPAFYALRGSDGMELAGKHLLATGHFLRRSGVVANDRVLEYGAGFGQTALAFARMGALVDTVDINADFSRAVQAQADFLRVPLRAHVGSFGEIPRPGDRYKLIFFYEAFHHSRDFLRLIAQMHGMLAEGGRILLGGEPITLDPNSPSIPYPWGMRLDAENAAVVRHRGWYELGFQEDFLLTSFVRAGYECLKHPCEASDFAMIYEFRPRPAVVSMDVAALIPSDAATWHVPDPGGRWTTSRSTMTLDCRRLERRLRITATNHHPVPVSVIFRAGGLDQEQTFEPRQRIEVQLRIADGDRLVIECDPICPASYGSTDNRLLGIFVEQIALEFMKPLPALAVPGQCRPVVMAPSDAAPAGLEAASATPAAGTAEELVEAAYQAILRRPADPGGLSHHVENLRAEGGLQRTLERMLASDEFLGVFEGLGNTQEKRLLEQLPAPVKRIAIHSNCQGGNLARCLQAMTGARPPQFSIITGRQLAHPDEGVPPIRAALADNDLIIMQPKYAAEMLPRLPELAEKLVLVPAISFAAYHPDLCYVTTLGEMNEVSGPSGPYHSSIVYYAWRAGMGTAQTVDLFCEETFQQLRFFDYWESSSRALLEEGRAAGMPLDGLLNEWRARGCFMHSHNHPKLYVIADLARRLMPKLGLEALMIDPVDVVWDQLAETATWPIYPELAKRLGLQGGYRFKGNNAGPAGKAPIITLGLEEFVDRSFAAYTAATRSHEIECHRPFSGRYRELFGGMRSSARRVSASVVPVVEAMTDKSRHPYSGLPSRQFWKAAFPSGGLAGEMDPVDDPPFRIDSRTRIATAGSCFAQHLSRRLKQRGYEHFIAEAAPEGMPSDEAVRQNFGVYSARYGNIYTSRQLLQLFQRAYGEFVPSETAWPRSDGRLADPFRPEIMPEGFATIEHLSDARECHLAAVRSLFETLDVLVFTLGLTETWLSKDDRAALPLAPGVTAGQMDPDRYQFHNLDAAEVEADLEAFWQKLKAVNPSARLILTVSPVSLAATYENRHVLSSTTYSKAVLRVAAEAIARRYPNDCSYFPSYEIITGSFSRGAYYEADLRSVNSAGVDHVMRRFFAHYTVNEGPLDVDQELLAEARRNYLIVCEEDRLADAMT